MLQYIDGMYAIVAYDKNTGKSIHSLTYNDRSSQKGKDREHLHLLTRSLPGNIFIARDHIGIIPLYWGTDDNNRLWIASELK